MPFKSEAQRRYFNANRKELEAQGVDVDEWNNSSHGKKLPARTKEAFLAWGGGTMGLHPKGHGIGAELGYTNLLGTVPVPLGGIDIGGPQHGFQMGIAPSVGSDIGIAPYLGLRLNHPRRSGITRSFPRGLPEVIYDTLRGRTKEEAMRLSYPDGFEDETPEDDMSEQVNSSRNKKQPARTKAAQVKRARVKYLLKQAIAAKDLVNMDSADGAAADYITPMAWGGERAGRTQAMADAIGENTTFGVRHPMTQTLGHVLGGAGVGGLAGGLAGGILNSIVPALQGRRLSNPFMAGAGAGAGLGMTAGAIGGRYSAGRSRRNEMRRVNQLFDQDNAAGKVKPKDPELSTLAALFAPLRGAHRTGQVEAVRAMRENTPISEQRGTLRDPLHAASTVLGPLAGIPIGYGQNLKTQLTNGETREKERAPERRPKTASAIEKLACVLARNPQLKQANLNSFMSNLPSPSGIAAAGAIGGGLGGLLTNPGVDEQGRPNSRFRRALGGAALGGLGGYGLGHVMHGGVPMLNSALSRFKGQRADSENAAPGTFENPAANPLMADQLNEENAFYHGMNYPMHVAPQVVGGDINMNPRMPGLA